MLLQSTTIDAKVSSQINDCHINVNLHPNYDYLANSHYENSHYDKNFHDRLPNTKKGQIDKHKLQTAWHPKKPAKQFFQHPARTGTPSRSATHHRSLLQPLPPCPARTATLSLHGRILYLQTQNVLLLKVNHSIVRLGPIPQANAHDQASTTKAKTFMK
ncbi:hypothetical protein TPHA_0G03230 [Tetrapisispora phaffii CBS 4417]|uniref:Uncharacterized protein n=1 Tax=Tetrapisispora phaffii (strain ATCC 24235 / CBS 4417 / NBRC 1672 / NRRL Y-8282 / UCD 70-5) TaxID=1071381 RepID=G8BW85_TETPH|nr:hypothetical protein TPHA_0G03230 [Tetrapisispora phaffii CBS 4417]CCE64163.1 hypothetical protein TPHA_0G03230 [Tetrapisispora phaffii CBS 4417]